MEPPTALSVLNQPSTNLPPAQEYSLKHWLTSAATIHGQFATDWANGKRTDDGFMVESAYKALRKFGEIMKLVMVHPDFKQMMKNSSSELFRQYSSLRNSLLEAGKLKADMVNYLTEREHLYEAKFGPLQSTSNTQSTSADPIARLSALDPIPSTSPSSSSSAGGGPPSIQARMAALRQNGLSASSTKPPPPIVPLKPAALTSTNLAKLGASPKKAPRDLSPAPEGPISNGVGKLNGLAGGGIGIDYNAQRLQQTATGSSSNHSNPSLQHHPNFPRLPSSAEADFIAHFPSVDDLDFSPSNPPLPSFETSPPSPKSTRGPLPIPPRSPTSSTTPIPSAHSRDPAYHSAPSSFLPPPPPSSPTTSTSPSPVPSTSSSTTNSLKLPYTTDVKPKGLFNYLNSNQSNGSDSEAGKRPRVLMLDIRNADEWEEGTIAGETVCIDPNTVGGFEGISSKDLERAISSTRPSIESQRFSSRHNYDVLIIYDRSSTFLPTSKPSTTSSASQKVLWNLIECIYSLEFEKSLKRQPILLQGGWEKWRIDLGGRGIAGEYRRDGGENGNGERRGSKSGGTGEGEERKGRNRRTTIVDGSVSTNPTQPPQPLAYQPPPSPSHYAPSSNANGVVASSIPLSPSANPQPNGGGYFSPLSSYHSSYSSTNALLSPRLTMPPTAVQRPGSGASANYEGFSPGASIGYSSFGVGVGVGGGGRPSYPQPEIGRGYMLPSNPSSSSLSGAGGIDYGFLPPQHHSQPQQSFSPSSSLPPSTTHSPIPHSRIDYPSLNPRSSLPSTLSSTSYAPQPPSSYSSSSIPPQPNSSTRPPPPIPTSINLTRPPAIQPAPLRSNSITFNVSNYTGVSTTGSMRFRANDLKFGDQGIGLTGLKNLGNTCYMNSTVQCLSATVPFAKYFKGGAYKRDVNRSNPLGTQGHLADAVAELIQMIWEERYQFLSPITFRENITRWAPQFKGTDQHDAQEFLGFLLDGLHEDLNYIVDKPKPVEMSKERERDLESLPQQVMSEREWDIYRRRDDSFVVQCFQGQFRNQLKCLTCQTTSTTYNTFMPLSVPIPSGRGISKVTLQECITAFVKEEILDKEDAWNCPKCKVPRKATKKLSLSRLPPILVIHLKRFSFKGPFSDKIETQVQYPLSGLDLTSYMPPPLFDPKAGPVTTAPKGYVYDLYAVTNHYGNLSSGHYTAFVRNHNSWSNITDSRFTQADPSVVQSAKNAYILYFALRT